MKLMYYVLLSSSLLNYKKKKKKNYTCWKSNYNTWLYECTYSSEKENVVVIIKVSKSKLSNERFLCLPIG